MTSTGSRKCPYCDTVISPYSAPIVKVHYKNSPNCRELRDACILALRSEGNPESKIAALTGHGIETVRRALGTRHMKKAKQKTQSQSLTELVAEDFAHAVLDGYARMKEENEGLRAENAELLRQIQSNKRLEELRETEHKQVFQAKVEKAIAMPGER